MYIHIFEVLKDLSKIFLSISNEQVFTQEGLEIQIMNYTIFSKKGR
jgi:hypothetical protein